MGFFDSVFCMGLWENSLLYNKLELEYIHSILKAASYKNKVKKKNIKKIINFIIYTFSYKCVIDFVRQVLLQSFCSFMLK